MIGDLVVWKRVENAPMYIEYTHICHAHFEHMHDIYYIFD